MRPSSTPASLEPLRMSQQPIASRLSCRLARVVMSRTCSKTASSLIILIPPEPHSVCRAIGPLRPRTLRPLVWTTWMTRLIAKRLLRRRRGITWGSLASGSRPCQSLISRRRFVSMRTSNSVARLRATRVWAGAARQTAVGPFSTVLRSKRLPSMNSITRDLVMRISCPKNQQPLRRVIGVAVQKAVGH